VCCRAEELDAAVARALAEELAAEREFRRKQEEEVASTAGAATRMHIHFKPRVPQIHAMWAAVGVACGDADGRRPCGEPIPGVIVALHTVPNAVVPSSLRARLVLPLTAQSERFATALASGASPDTSGDDVPTKKLPKSTDAAEEGDESSEADEGKEMVLRRARRRRSLGGDREKGPGEGKGLIEDGDHLSLNEWHR